MQCRVRLPSHCWGSTLGLDANKVTQSNSLRPFILSLPSVLGGSEQGQAIALDMAPGWLIIAPEERSYTAYERESWRRHALRTRVGVALYEGVENEDNPAKSVSSRLAIGLSTSWLDDSDPLIARLPGQQDSAWRACLNRSGAAIQQMLEAPIPNGPNAAELTTLDAENQRLVQRKRDAERERDATQNPTQRARLDGELEQINTRLREIAAIFTAHTAAARTALTGAYTRSDARAAVGRCAAEADRAARLAQDLDFGVGAIWRGEPGQVSDFESAGGAVWLSYRRPFGLPDTVNPADAASMRRLNTWWMVGGALRAGFDEYVATGNSATPEIRASTWDAWVGVERNSDAQRFSLQAGYQERDPNDATAATFERSRTRYLASYAQRLGDRESSVWLNISYGDAQGHGAFADDEALLVSIMFAPPDPRRIFGAP